MALVCSTFVYFLVDRVEGELLLLSVILLRQETGGSHGYSDSFLAFTNR